MQTPIKRLSQQFSKNTALNPKEKSLIILQSVLASTSLRSINHCFKKIGLFSLKKHKKDQTDTCLRNKTSTSSPFAQSPKEKKLKRSQSLNESKYALQTLKKVSRIHTKTYESREENVAEKSIHNLQNLRKKISDKKQTTLKTAKSKYIIETEKQQASSMGLIFSELKNLREQVQQVKQMNQILLKNTTSNPKKTYDFSIPYVSSPGYTNPDFFQKLGINRKNNEQVKYQSEKKQTQSQPQSRKRSITPKVNFRFISPMNKKENVQPERVRILSQMNQEKGTRINMRKNIIGQTQIHRY